jgi:hypothetical protein
MPDLSPQSSSAARQTNRPSISKCLDEFITQIEAVTDQELGAQSFWRLYAVDLVR